MRKRGPHRDEATVRAVLSLIRLGSRGACRAPITDEVVADPSPEETAILRKVEVSSEPTPKKTSDNKASKKNDSTDSKDKK